MEEWRRWGDEVQRTLHEKESEMERSSAAAMSSLQQQELRLKQIQVEVMRLSAALVISSVVKGHAD